MATGSPPIAITTHKKFIRSLSFPLEGNNVNHRSITKGAHLNGSLAVPDATTGLRTAAHHLGGHLEAITDGEPGWRQHWIEGIFPILVGYPGFSLVGQKPGEAIAGPAYDGFPILEVADSVDHIPRFGYGTEARRSYKLFCALRDEGVIPDKGVRFQVCLPTPYAPVAAFIAEEHQERLLPIMEQTIADEIGDALLGIPPEDLAIQFDVAIEIGVLEGAFTVANGLGTKEVIGESLWRAFDLIPPGVRRYMHTCYGDRLHQHFVAPKDLELCVQLANAVRPDLVSMPVDRDNALKPGYFDPVGDLDAMIQLALGVIDYAGDEHRTGLLIETAEVSGVPPFKVCTECGMARLSEREGMPNGPSLDRLLAMHAKFSAPIRDSGRN